MMSGRNERGIDKFRSNCIIDNNDDKKRKKLEQEQVEAMEGLFKMCRHPDEKQLQQLGKQFGLDPEKVKLWFQNRCFQATLERGENTLVESSCHYCGFRRDAITSIEEQKLRQENSRLRAEVEKLRSIRNFVSNQKLRITDTVKRSMIQLKEMADSKEPLWVKSYDTGLEVLNFDEYMKMFCQDDSNNMQQTKSIEASRESAIVFIDLQRLIKSFMNVNQWREMFPCLISNAVTLDVICCGEDVNRDGAIQLMFVETQMLTPMVANREIYFVRYCKQLAPYHWGIVDVSIDDKNMDASVQKCSKRPSGCIIEVQRNGYCKVTWVEHVECQYSRGRSAYLNIVNSGLAFGAKHWISTLQLQCEQLLFLNTTIIPTQDSGVATLAGRKGLLTLAQGMTQRFCRTLGASSIDSWKKVTTESGVDVMLALRNNMNDPGEPLGTILCAASSVWLPIAHQTLINLLTDEKKRKEWDIMTTGYSVKRKANVIKGYDDKNSVAVLAMKNEQNKVFILQDVSRNEFESMVVYAPMDSTSLNRVMSGSGSTNTAVLASGFSILPDGVKTGSLVSIGFQMLISDYPSVQVSNKSVDSVVLLVLCTLQKIRKCLFE